jgi:hypothetical protein
VRRDARVSYVSREVQMRKRWFRAPSPALVVSVIALFVALSGTGYAASGAIFGHADAKADTKLIKSLAPSLGVSTANSLTTLPSGGSESGFFAGNATDGFIALAINYPRPLSAPVDEAKIVDVHGASAAHCPGIGQAARGYLCLYNTEFLGLTGSASHGGGGKLGVILYWAVTGAGYVGGAWTVTAP